MSAPEITIHTHADPEHVGHPFFLSLGHPPIHGMITVEQMVAGLIDE